MNKVEYDREVDAAYLKIKDGEYIESDEIIDGVILHTAKMALPLQWNSLV